MCLTISIIEKRNFTHNKKIDIENSKNWIFPKGCVHGFGEEIEISMFLFWAKEQRKCIELKKFFIAKKGFPGNDNINFKKVEKLQFSKGVSPWFWVEL